MHVELDYKLAVALANVTEGAARSTFLKINQVEPSHGFVAWQALVDGYTPKSSNDPAHSAAAHTCDTQSAQERKGTEREAHNILKVAEYEHQCLAIDEAQKTFVAREMMPKDIMREFLTRPRKFNEIMEK